MKVHYFDPSAWVKRHFQEKGSEALNELFAAPLHASCCRLGIVEMVATIARKSRQESLDPAVTQMLLDNVEADWSLFQIVAIDESCIVGAADVALRHRLRAMDALHLACALSLVKEHEVVMVSADEELLAAASNEKLEVLNPTDE